MAAKSKTDLPATLQNIDDMNIDDIIVEYDQPPALRTLIAYHASFVWQHCLDRIGDVAVICVLDLSNPVAKHFAMRAVVAASTGPMMFPLRHVQRQDPRLPPPFLIHVIGRDAACEALEYLRIHPLAEHIRNDDQADKIGVLFLGVKRHFYTHCGPTSPARSPVARRRKRIRSGRRRTTSRS